MDNEDVAQPAMSPLVVDVAPNGDLSLPEQEEKTVGVEAELVTEEPGTVEEEVPTEEVTPIVDEVSVPPTESLPEGTIGFIKLHDDAQLPTRATNGSVGYDLSVVGDHTILRGEVKVIPTGLALADNLPSNMELQVRPRSSLMLKYGLLVANSPGTIDQDYSGEVGIVVWFPPKDLPTAGTIDYQITIPHGTRIAQLVFAPVLLPPVQFVAQAAERADRGGFGSTD